MCRIPVLLILFFAIAHGLSTQSPGGGGKKPSTTGSTPTNPTNPTTSPNLQPTDTMPRSFFLSGKVMVDDGTLLTDSVIIQSICKGRTHIEGYTDSKGHFSFEINSLKESGAEGNAAGSAQASDSPQFGLERDQMETGFGQTRLGSDRLRDYWRDCELQAVLPGFTSQIVHMAGKLDNIGVTDVGAIVLHRLDQVHGFTISATSAGAPAKARKEYEKGRELEKKEKWDPAMAHTVG
jgi:hypothetical protein